MPFRGSRKYNNDLPETHALEPTGTHFEAGRERRTVQLLESNRRALFTLEGEGQPCLPMSPRRVRGR